MDRERIEREHLIERYLRGDLDAETEAELEVAILESVELQDALEAAMVLGSALRMSAKSSAAAGGQDTPQEISAHSIEPSADERRGDDYTGDDHPGDESGSVGAGGVGPRNLEYGHQHTVASSGGGWTPLAMAAGLVLSVLFAAIWWQSQSEIRSLEAQLRALEQPTADVLNVELDIMRSAGRHFDRVQLPADQALLLFSIELPGQVDTGTPFHYRLSPLAEEDDEVIGGQPQDPVDNGPLYSGRLLSEPDRRVMLAMRAGALKAGDYQLDILSAAPASEPVLRRFLRFLPPIEAAAGQD